MQIKRGRRIARIPKFNFYTLITILLLYELTLNKYFNNLVEVVITVLTNDGCLSNLLRRGLVRTLHPCGDHVGLQ